MHCSNTHFCQLIIISIGINQLQWNIKADRVTCSEHITNEVFDEFLRKCFVYHPSQPPLSKLTRTRGLRHGDSDKQTV